MIYIRYRGIGPLVLIFPLIFSGFGHLIIERIFKDNSYYERHAWPTLVAFTLAGTTTWFLGKYLNSRTRKVINKQTDKEIIVKSLHDIYDVKIEYFGIPMILLGVLIGLSSSYYTAKQDIVQETPLNSVDFFIKGMKSEFNKRDKKVWLTKNNDYVCFYYTDKPTYSTDDMLTIDNIRKYYRKVAAQHNGGIVEVEDIKLDSCQAIRAITKKPQNSVGGGMTYNGYILFPFQNLNYILEIQCREEGITGVRDTAIFAKKMINKKGDIEIADDQDAFEGWTQDPYDPAIKTKIMRNLSDDEIYDKDFPEHPLSRLRSIMKQFQETVKIDKKIKKQSVFFKNYDSK